MNCCFNLSERGCMWSADNFKFIVKFWTRIPPPQSNFHSHAAFRKFWLNNRLAPSLGLTPLWEILDPSLVGI